ncbi:type II toxin-antitoxin system YafQ family toxin [Cardiobacterium sp. Marseille-Q4385]|uniref:type II toxin-antitoxin system YafQ family toxin n=1 Tax=Cardiobacterium sp. Marseille-Q4385 TaxID=2866573 RepID=UPI001CE432D5|nr:type II toxin-antitoxin system YafQ family toxin [Cardiobacterium sp. Marseille-Q4385]
MPLRPLRTKQFERDIKRCQKRGKNMEKLKTLIVLLLEEQPLPIHYHDHPLGGDWQDWRDAHIEPDWLLLYRVDDGALILSRTGSHADLFG